MSEENELEFTPAVQGSAANIAASMVEVLEDDPTVRAHIALPNFDAVSDRRIISELKKLCPGFDFEPGEDYTRRIDTFDKLVSYTKNADEDLLNFEKTTKIKQITDSSIANVRRWHLGYVIGQVLAKAEYGSNTVEKLAKMTGNVPSYIYQLRDVGRNLSLKDVYMLGMYDAGWSIVRTLGALTDADMRSRLIRMYCESITDWNNEPMRIQAKKSLMDAIIATKSGAYNELDCADPAQLITSADLETIAPEWAAADKLLDKLLKLFRPVKQQLFEDASSVFGDYFLMADVPGASIRQDGVKQKAQAILDALNVVQNNIADLQAELQSLLASELVEPEHDDSTKEDN